MQLQCRVAKSRLESKRVAPHHLPTMCFLAIWSQPYRERMGVHQMAHREVHRRLWWSVTFGASVTLTVLAQGKRLGKAPAVCPGRRKLQSRTYKMDLVRRPLLHIVDLGRRHSSQGIGSSKTSCRSCRSMAAIQALLPKGSKTTPHTTLAWLRKTMRICRHGHTRCEGRGSPPQCL